MEESRTYVVTGGGSGIGRAIAESLARQGGRVVIVCRDRARGERARDEIRRLTSSQMVDLVLGDLASREGALSAGRGVREACKRIDALIHNAGIWPTKLERNGEGLERSFAINALAPFVLNHVLRDRLKDSGARIVQVTAGLYPLGRADVERTPRGEDFARMRTYANTKLWNLINTLELARRVEGTGVTVNAVHPGVVRTRLGESGGIASKLFHGAKVLWASPETGAKGPVHLAVSPELAGVNGVYYDQLKRTPLASIAEDRVLSWALWDKTTQLARLD